MEIEALIRMLSDPAAYPDQLGDEAIEVHQTHISVVFVVGAHAYKIKKPVGFGFVDYDTVEKRRWFCEQEVHLNRRLAPSVYLGTVPITIDGPGLRMDGRGEVVEWAVKMERLPDDATLAERLRRGEIGVEHMEALADRIAAFHAQAEAGPAIAACGRFDVVAGNARENFDQSAAHVGITVSQVVLERLRRLTESILADLRPVIEARAARGVPRDGHGDLRLDHVYLFPDRPPPANLIVVDCIEFNERLRFADPVADMSFLVMELAARGRRDLARAFADAYFLASGDAEGRALLPFYTSYRAAVRGKVEGMESFEPEVPEAERGAALQRARVFWLLALAELEEPSRRPCLVLVGGLPGSGKSTLARSLSERAGFVVIRSDLVRKELAGLGAGQASRSPFEAGIYAPEWTERTYAECLRREEGLLFEGCRVLVDASFGTEASRRAFLEMGQRWGVPILLILCQADPDVVRGRLGRRRDDASDADWSIYMRALERWEPPGEAFGLATRRIDTGEVKPGAVVRAFDVLVQSDLLKPLPAAPPSDAPGFRPLEE